MHFQSQLIYKLTFGTFLMLWAHSTAEVLRNEASLNNLYNNLLQREYAGPVIFPNHQVERKAQRSPSLRLRFGRRSDPDLLPQNLEKRWFGEVNQKPIRSPSLRLRFGRRSDPSMPMHSAYDILMNGQQTPENNEDYSDVYDAYYNRVVRKPQRLRFGRSLSYQSPLNTATNDNDLLESGDELNDVAMLNSEDDFYNNLMHTQKLRNLLMSLTKYGINQDNNEVMETAEDESMDEFERAIRKPGPLRLRWGRSTGTRSSVLDKEIKAKNENKVAEVVNDVADKSVNQQNKD